MRRAFAAGPAVGVDGALEAVDRLPLSALSHYYLGLALHRLAQPDVAETALRNALEIAPDFVPAHRRLAAVHRMQGNILAASERLLEARDALERKNRRRAAE